MRSDDRLFVIIFLTILGVVATAAVLPRMLADGWGAASAGGATPADLGSPASHRVPVADGEPPSARGSATARAGASRAVDLEGSVPQGPAAVRAALEELVEPPFDAVLPPSDRLLPELSEALRQMQAGEVPERLARRLGPFGEVLVREDEEGRLVLAAGTRRRYRPVVELVESLDPRALAAAVSEVSPLLTGSLAGAARAAEVEDQVRAALDHVLDVHVADGPVEMEQRSTRYVFAEDDLQALRPIQQHLVLMGPDNAARVQAVLKEVRDLLGGDEAPAGTRATVLAAASPPVPAPADEPPVPGRATGSGREVTERPTAP